MSKHFIVNDVFHKNIVMKIILPFTLLSILLVSCNHDNVNGHGQNAEDDTNKFYDVNLAMDAGADEYGMKQYVMAFLKSGPNRTHDSATASNIQRSHLDNIQKMASEGKLLLAGPFLDGGEYRGIYIFNISSIEEAQRLTASDPAVKAGRLIMELHPWYGTAALIEVNDLHKRYAKKEI
jgi:uncharacterized protein YciI